MIKQSSRLYAKNWEAVGTGENLLNQEVDKEMYREIYLTDRQTGDERKRKVPIIAMTANAFTEDIQHSLAAGMNAHVSKPVEMKVLEKTIRSIKSGGGGYRTAGHGTGQMDLMRQCNFIKTGG